MQDKISIITASYNYAELIKETIESVLNQTYSNWEMIIVDDGSKDNSIEVINEYCKKDERIKLFTHENNQNKGLIETIKLGIEKSQSEWIVFLESDDTITPNYLERKLQTAKEHPEVEFIFNNVNLFGFKDKIELFEKHFDKINKILKENPYPANLLKYFKKDNLVGTFSVVMAKKKLFNNLDYNCPNKAFIDYYLWIQIAKNTNLFYLDEKLTNWRLHNSYMTRAKNYKENELLKCKKKILFLNNFEKAIISPFLYLIAYINIFKKFIIRIHLKEKKVYIFNKEYNLNKGK